MDFPLRRITMIITRGRERVGTWNIIATEDAFKSNTLYGLVYRVEIEKPWWSYILWFIKFKPDKFAEDIPREVERLAGIPQNEIKVYWWIYDDETNIFRVQIKWIPEETQIEPGLGIALAIIVLCISGSIISGFSYFTLRMIGKPTLEQIEEFVTETVNKTLLYLDILAGCICVAYLTPLFLKNKGKEKF